jgi:L-rhamnose mutarotase
MQLKPGFENEYKKRHDEIWPELSDLLSDAGISNFSIFLDEETLTLFAIEELSDDNRVSDLQNNPLMRKWWDSMAHVMDNNPDGTPVVIPLKEVFHMD